MHSTMRALTQHIADLEAACSNLQKRFQDLMDLANINSPYYVAVVEIQSDGSSHARAQIQGIPRAEVAFPFDTRSSAHQQLNLAKLEEDWNATSDAHIAPINAALKSLLDTVFIESNNPPALGKAQIRLAMSTINILVDIGWHRTENIKPLQKRPDAHRLVLPKESEALLNALLSMHTVHHQPPIKPNAPLWQVEAHLTSLHRYEESVDFSTEVHASNEREAILLAGLHGVSSLFSPNRIQGLKVYHKKHILLSKYVIQPLRGTYAS